MEGVLRLQTPFESQLRDLILREEINRPLIFRGIHKNWNPCKMTLDDWAELFKDETLTVRYGKQHWNRIQPQWESECGKAELKWKEIIQWNNGDYQFLPQDGTRDDIWIYYDYRYLPDVFHFNSTKDERKRDFLKVITLNESLKKKFCWSKLGFPDRNSDHSTLWIGTKGSYTPTHYDTYSCNLVCQVYGRKKWTLFPPTDTEHLLPTRIPYEESSVYSKINFASKKRMTSHVQDLEKCSPYQIILEAGDCLFLPQKWWHFVQSEDFSISVNTWIELPGDHSARLEESILRSITSTVVNMSFPDAAENILNPNEMDVADMSESDLNELLQAASSAYIESQSSKILDQQCDNEEKGTLEGTSSASPLKKKMKRCALTLVDFLVRYPSIVETLPLVDYKTLCSLPEAGENEEKKEDASRDLVSSRSPTYLEHLINAIGKPSILKGISEEFLKLVTQHPPK